MWGKSCGPLDAKSRDIWGVVSFSHKTRVVAPLFFPFLGCQPPLFPLLGRLSPFPFAATLHCFLLPRDLPHAARIEKRRSKMDWRGREDQGDVLPPSIADFLGEPLGKDGILVPPYNYVLLEVVDRVDWRIRGWIRCGVRFWSRI
jgi:hypothetical protein